MPDSGDTCDTDDSLTPGEEGGSPTCDTSAKSTDESKKQQRRTHVDVPLAPREVRSQTHSYHPLEYIHLLLLKATGYTLSRELNVEILNHLTHQQCYSINDVKKAMQSINCTHHDVSIAPAYAAELGIQTPYYDSTEVVQILDKMEFFLDTFGSMKDADELPYHRKHEPHTGTTIRRVAHMLGFHHYEPAFRDLAPKQMKQTGRVIQAVFEKLGWPYAEPCDGKRDY